MDVITGSQQLEATGLELLQKLHVVQILAAYGQVALVGSLVTHTMIRPDIDIFCMSPVDLMSSAAEEIKGAFSRLPGFVSITELQQFDELQPKPFGYKWQIMMNYRGVEWKIDLWYVRARDRYAQTAIRETEELRKLTTTDLALREKLIRAKQGAFARSPELYRQQKREIYSAILKSRP